MKVKGFQTKLPLNLTVFESERTAAAQGTQEQEDRDKGGLFWRKLGNGADARESMYIDGDGIRAVDSTTVKTDNFHRSSMKN